VNAETVEAFPGLVLSRNIKEKEKYKHLKQCVAWELTPIPDTLLVTFLAWPFSDTKAFSGTYPTACEAVV